MTVELQERTLAARHGRRNGSETSVMPRRAETLSWELSDAHVLILRPMKLRHPQQKSNLWGSVHSLRGIRMQRDHALEIAEILRHPAFKRAVETLDVEHERTIADIITLTEIPSPPF